MWGWREGCGDGAVGLVGWKWSWEENGDEGGEEKERKVLMFIYSCFGFRLGGVALGTRHAQRAETVAKR